MRRAFAFNGKFIIPTLMEVLDMSEDDAKTWFNDKTATEISIAQLVKDMKAYVDTKPANFRLLFMIDEVGQYVGTDTDMLLNLQSLTEKIGSECEGKIWVICTGQEAIDEIIKVRADEFSRIQARFKTRLSLSSSSVDEVIQKRILKKKPEAAKDLEGIYEQNDSVLRNLFSFSGSILDIKGYSGPREFTENFPFVPYQFIIMQKVFAEIRKHGNSGKHLSGGERSMLSGFQEAAQKIQEKDEYALVPFFRFYDTVHTFLDGSIRRVIERCQKAADNGDGIEQQDVDVLKLLYLIRYIDDIPSNLDNIVILMADDIRVDKIIMRDSIRITVDSPEKLIQMMEHNELDMIYILDTPRWDSNWIKVMEKAEPVMFVTSVSHRLAKERNLLLDDLLKESFYLTERNANYRQALDGQLALRRKELSPMLEISDTAFIKKMLMRGGGVSFLPRFAVEDDIEKKKLTLLDVKDIEITMYRQIFYHKNKFKTKEMEKFAEFALEDN